MKSHLDSVGIGISRAVNRHGQRVGALVSLCHVQLHRLTSASDRERSDNGSGLVLSRISLGQPVRHQHIVAWKSNE